jgi:hypothetical protein
MKKIAWTIVMTMASAAGAALAARAANLVWRKVTNEPPPTPQWWARWLIARPVQAGVTGVLDGQH